jgi:hypothetical protein
MSSCILADTVVERSPGATVPEQRVPATKWNDALSRKISESFQQAQRGLRGSRIESIMESQALAHADQKTALSIYRRATLIDKQKIARIFRLPHVSTDPVYDHMSDPALIEQQRNGSAAPSGIMYDLMSEEDLWNPRGACYSVVRVYMFDEWDIRVGVRGAPALHSLLDERMGPVRTVEAGTKNKVLCPTCARVTLGTFSCLAPSGTP